MCTKKLFDAFKKFLIYLEELGSSFEPVLLGKMSKFG